MVRRRGSTDPRQTAEGSRSVSEEPIRNSSPTAASAIVVVLVGLLLAAQVARLTVASAVVDRDPAMASRLAPHAPATLAANAMAQVGLAAGRQSAPGEKTMGLLRELAAISPLDPAPFLVNGAIAAREGRYAQAEKLFDQARTRAPRAPAARYLLADVLLRQGKVGEGLREIAILSRLVPAASVQLVPSLAAYAQSPGAREKLAAVLDHNPQLKNPLLAALAENPRNAELILALAGPLTGAADNDMRVWQTRLLLGFIREGDYEGAYRLWRRFARLPGGARPLLFNGEFRKLSAPVPFNWDFRGSPAGIAEPGPDRLRVLYYGRQDTVLTTQLLLLPPGNYRLQSPISGHVVPGALSWSLGCVDAQGLLLDLKLAASSENAGSFDVPASGCPAQRLVLNARAQDSPDDSDARIGPVTIQRIGA